MAKLRTIDRGKEWVDGKLLKDLDYADDICLLARDMVAMKQMTELVVGESDKVGLKINTRKSGIMKIRSSDNQRVISLACILTIFSNTTKKSSSL